MGNLEKNIAINAENRADFARIANWIAPNAKVLDLGCGDGSLLTQLRKTHNIRGYGVEKDDANWLKAMNNALMSFKWIWSLVYQVLKPSLLMW